MSSPTTSHFTDVLALDRQRDRGADRPAHLLDRLLERHALNLLAVELGDDVLGADAGLGGGRVVDRALDADQLLEHLHLDAEAAELAVGVGAHLLEGLGVHVARMRVEARQHAVDGAFDELGVLRLLDVVGAHPLEHVAEQVELTVGVGRARRLCRGAEEGARVGGDSGRGGAYDGPEENQSNLAHHPPTFSPGVPAHQGEGSIEPRSLRNST
jgi:hypothetical protein